MHSNFKTKRFYRTAATPLAELGQAVRCRGLVRQAPPKRYAQASENANSA